MMQLFDFQRDAANQIADRYIEYAANAVITGTRQKMVVVPFFQALSSVTASGKTVILAESVATIADYEQIAPVVLWLSKGKVVVEQTYANLSAGGKYHHLLRHAEFRTLAEYDPRQVKIAPEAQIFFATVGTFNQKDKEAGSRLIFKSELDSADRSTWEALKLRQDDNGARRPLVVVYDEAHNLTDQQVDLLLELEPDAFLLASATMRLSQRLSDQVDLLKGSGRTDDWLVTQVDPKAVAASGLIKSTVVLGGYRAPMEETVSAMLQDMAEAEQDARVAGLAEAPKAIYVSNTNIVEGNAFQRDDPNRPFAQRQAPPILIWRHLVEHHGIDPDRIAVYCNLDFKKSYPPPSEFHLFKGGDDDYAAFIAGDYQHIIFNLGLQEGWDDPYCYFAYIDKGMESRVQIEQIVGRLLRQPEATHYPAERLNTAHFYVRVDKNEAFNAVLTEVSTKLASDAPDIRLIRKSPEKSAPIRLSPKGDYTVPETAYHTEEASREIGNILNGLSDYRQDDGRNTLSDGERLVVSRQLGEKGNTIGEWEHFGHSGTVSARWLFQREVRNRFPGALGVAPTSDPKFDARIGFDSNAHRHIEQVAEAVVEAYIDNVRLRQRRLDPYPVGSILARRDDMAIFTNALHEGYDGLNNLELPFAQALDRTGLPWCRNPPRTGYGIPLISKGPTSNFYPDFLVWKDDTVIAIDTTGGHLLDEKMSRKLLMVEPAKGSTTRLIIRFVSQGNYDTPRAKKNSAGFTLWGIKPDGAFRATHLTDIDAAVEAALRI